MKFVFEYAFDDIGNRTVSKAGGNPEGRELRPTGYSVNLLNQYIARTNSDMVDIIGLAHPQASVSVDEEDGRLSRRGAYFRKEHNIGNNVYPTIEVKAVLGTNEVTETGAIFNPPAVESYSYDADGNLTADGRWSYVWDAENRLIEMVSLTNTPAASKRRLKFSYDAQSRRIGKTAESWDGSAWVMRVNNLFIYDGWSLLAELNATNNAAIRTYVWGLDLSGSMQGAGGVGGLLAVKDSSEGTHFAAYDGNGNVVGLVAGNSGEVSGVYEYDPFGQTIRRSGAMAASNPVRFSSKHEDAESRYLYYGYRYYNANPGRWLNRDPIDELDAVNLFLLLGNDAVNRIDVFGLIQWRTLATLYLHFNGTIVDVLPDTPVNIPNNTLAVTVPSYKINWVKCECTKAGFKYKDGSADGWPEVYTLASYPTPAMAAWVERAEEDHVKDFNTWFTSFTVPAIERTETSLRGKLFASMAGCESVSRHRIDATITGSLRAAIRATIARHDTPGRHTWGHPNQRP